MHSICGAFKINKIIFTKSRKLRSQIMSKTQIKLAKACQTNCALWPFTKQKLDYKDKLFIENKSKQIIWILFECATAND